MTKKQIDLFKLVTRLVVERDGKILLVKRSNTDIKRPGEWELPGGIVDSGETLEVGAARELAEETGLSGELTYLGSRAYFIEDLNRLAAYFYITPTSDDVVLSEEHSEYDWVESSKIYNFDMNKHNKDFLVESLLQDVSDEKDNDQNTTNSQLIIYTDGGSRGNPGPSASGYVIMDANKNVLEEGGEYLGITTNNQAEYQAVKLALEQAEKYSPESIDFFIDSMLVVKQMSGEYKIKNRDLWPIHEAIKKLAEKYESVTFTHVYRDKNSHADAQVNHVLDARAEQ